MKVSFLFFVLAIFFITASARAANDSASVTITFNNMVGNEQVELGKTFNNPFNEAFTVKRFKYYISNLTFYKTDGTIVNIPSSYYLLNEEDSLSKKLSVLLKTGSYNKVSFLIGVDSVKNVSGTQTDALDPMNGMFWTWNSGYIMAKLEATSPLSKAPNQLVEYHIGGFRYNQNTVRRVTLSFPSNEVLRVGDNQQPKILIEADINTWFSSTHDLKIAEHTTCTTPGDLAIKYADNYSNMFKVVSISH